MSPDDKALLAEEEPAPDKNWKEKLAEAAQDRIIFIP